MVSLFRNTQATQPAAPIAAFQVQTSAIGKAFPIIYGTTRVAGNLLWYGDFYSVQTGSQSGKGGGGGGKSGLFSSPNTNSGYEYFTSVAIGICEGPIVGFGQVFVDKAVWTSAATYGFTTFLGTYPQTGWSYLTTYHQQINQVATIPSAPGPYVFQVQFSQAPFTDGGVVSDGGTVFTKVTTAPAATQYKVSPTGLYTFNSADAGTEVTITYQANNQQPPNEALGYNGLAYVGFPGLSLGSSAALPNFNFEIMGIYSNSVSGSLDADASLIVNDLMTNAHYGAGFPSAFMGSLATYQNYVLAAGLLVSVSYSDQQAVSKMIDDLGLATNSAPVWNGTSFTIVPYGDTAITGNGKTYTPPSQPAFSLGDDDYLPNQGSSASSSASSGDDPVLMDRKRPADKVNSVKIEFLNRANSYNVELVEAKEQALIDTYGKRQAPSAQGHMFASAAAARMSAQLNLLRQLISNVFTFTVDARFAAIDPMDIVAITDTTLGLNAQWVRVTEITENDDDTFTIVAEEYLQGTGAAPVYNFQQTAGFSGNTNEDPGLVNPPIVFEPTDELGQTMGLGGGLIIAAAVSGVNAGTWGGCQVWASYQVDGDYAQVGTIIGPSRMGVLTATLPSYTANATGQTIDTTSTLSVDMSQSGGLLSSGTIDDATSLNTRCYVGPAMGTAQGEIVAYQTATLGISASKYALTTLVRGGYGTEDQIAAWSAGTSFVRLDNSIAIFPYDQSRIGATLYLKFLSFNIWGGGLQSLGAVEPYSYAIQGYALSSPLPDVINFRSSYVAATTNLNWDEIEDFRPVLYEIRKGASWAGSQSLGRVAHPPFATYGDGTYWVAAYSQPASGLVVYSETPQSIVISGSVITENILETWDEFATGWTGTFIGGAGVDSGSGYAKTGGQGDIIIAADVLILPDFLDYGGTGDGVYTIPASHIINVGYVGSNQVMITWVATGGPSNQDILTIADVLTMPDFSGALSTAFIDVYPEIQLSQDGIIWGAWQKFAPGVYTAMAYNARLQLQTIDPATIAYCESFTFGINVPARIDHYTNVALTAGLTANVWTNHTGSIATAQSVFGGSSYNCGSSAGWVDTPDSANFTLGGGDWTIDCWFNKQGGDGTIRRIAGQNNSANTDRSFTIGLNAADKFTSNVTSDGTTAIAVTGTTVFTGLTGWNHIAFVRTGNILRLFVNGVQEGGDTPCSATLWDSSSNLTVGKDNSSSSNPWYGYLDEFRMSVGIARWTANFTPPIAAYGPDTYTKILLHFDGTDGSTTITESSPPGNSIIFEPDGAASTAPFNGGPNGATVPAMQITILNAQPGDDAIISGLTLAGCVLQVTNASVGVARNVNALVEGF